MKTIFLIYAPSWRLNAAGIKVLHLLCHFLNRNGFESYLILHSGFNSRDSVNLELSTRLMSRKIFRRLKREGCKFVTIYPESVVNDPLRTETFITYYLNLPGSLVSRGNTSTSLGIGYTKKISEDLGLPKAQTLFIPSISEDIFSFAWTRQDKVSVYLGKQRDFDGISFDLPRNSVLLYRNGRSKLPREKLLNTISQSDYLIVFENTSVILESLLLGTPVQTVFSHDFRYLFSEYELGTYGCFENLEDLDKAKSEIEIFREKYQLVIKDLDSKVVEFAKLVLKNPPYSGSQLRIPLHFVLVLRHNNYMFKAALKKIGPARTFLISMRRLGILK